MRSRILFLAIVCFWLAMNYLLWRSQWGAHSQLGSAVPAAVVWEKILTAPDLSTLDIYDHEKRVGSCHWSATAANSSAASKKFLEDDYEPDGMEEQVTGYSLNFGGNASFSAGNRLGFEASLDLSTNHTWQALHVRVTERPQIWELRATAATEKLTVKVEDLKGSWQKTLSFSDLNNPDALWADVGGTAALSLLGAAGLTPSKESLSSMAGSVEWRAHEDWMQFGHTRARAYRLETVFLGRPIIVFTSRVGEILWVELPNRITLRNDAFEHF
jgi:hypothetical protein